MIDIKKFRMKKTLLLLTIALLAMACNSTRPSPSTPPPPVYKFDILLKGQITPDGLEASFKEYGLSDQGRSSRSQNRWLFTYNAETIDGKVLLEKIRQHADVLDVQMYPVN